MAGVIVGIVVFIFLWANRDKDDKKSSSGQKRKSKDDEWLEENSWVWSDPNYNGKRK